MKNLKSISLGLMLLISNVFITFSQNIIAFENMETWNWSGVWLGSNSGTATWATNHSVSPTQSAVIYGLGTGNSGIEQAWYVLPNVIGLNPNSQYEFRFRLASYRVTSANATRGVDVGDFVDVQISYDGELTYTSELRITGNNNAFWDYNTTGVINHVANGSYTNSLAPIGDVYRSGPGNQQFTGPSVINLQLPPGITQVAIDLYCRVNASGEEWWFDNIELVEIPNMPLHIDLTSFTGTKKQNQNLIEWVTASEQNNSHFILESSINGLFNENKVINTQNGSGNSSISLKYSFVDNNPSSVINYYRLKQVDMNGDFKYYGPISIDNRENNNRILKYINTIGQEVSEDTKGLVLIIYEDGTSEKIIR